MEQFFLKIYQRFGLSPHIALKRAAAYSYPFSDMLYILYLYNVSFFDPFLEEERFCRAAKKLTLSAVFHALDDVLERMNRPDSREEIAWMEKEWIAEGKRIEKTLTMDNSMDKGENYLEGHDEIS